MKVFISYSRKDRDICDQLAKHMASFKDTEVWYDKGLIPGELYARTIAEKLQQTDFCAALISENSMGSDWVKDELSYAKDHRKTIIPIWLENTQLPADIDLMLHRYQSLFWYLRKSDAEFIAELRASLCGNDSNREALFEGFGNEFSEAENNRLRVCLEKEQQGEYSFCYTAENALLLGKAYLFGGPVPGDPSKAKHYLKIARYFGSRDAECYLTQLELEQLGEAENKEVYKPYMETIDRLAREGSVAAGMFLGNAFWYGRYGLKECHQTSAQYYEECARAGNARAQYIMSSDYYDGDGVPQDYDLAIMYANLAVEQKYIKAWRRWGKFYRDGKAIPKDLRKAIEAYERGARWGDYNCYNKIGDIHLFDCGVEADPDHAVRCYRKALEAPLNGQKYALRKANAALGYCYEHGYGVEADRHQAAEHYLLAYKYGDADARSALLRCSEESE